MTAHIRKQSDIFQLCCAKLRSRINGIQTDWNLLYSSIEKTIELHNAVSDFTPDKKAQTINSLKNSDFTSDAKSKGEILGKYIEKWTTFSDLCKIDKSVENSTNWFADLNAFLTNLSDNIYELGQWTSLNSITEELNSNGLENITQAVNQGIVSPEEIESSFNCNLYYELILAELNPN